MYKDKAGSALIAVWEFKNIMTLVLFLDSVLFSIWHMFFDDPFKNTE